MTWATSEKTYTRIQVMYTVILGRKDRVGKNHAHTRDTRHSPRELFETHAFARTLHVFASRRSSRQRVVSIRRRTCEVLIAFSTAELLFQSNVLISLHEHYLTPTLKLFMQLYQAWLQDRTIIVKLKEGRLDSTSKIHAHPQDTRNMTRVFRSHSPLSPKFETSCSRTSVLPRTFF